MTKKIYLLFIFALLVTGGTLAYTINYVLNTTTQHNVGVGNTVKTVDGLTVTLNNVEQGNLTYYALEESTTDKHTLTYTYGYTIHNVVYDIVVSSLSNDIIVVNYIVTDVITVEIALNQDMEFNTGDSIDFTLLFELVEKTSININTATYDELIELGFSDREATEISNLTYIVMSLDELYGYIYVGDIHTRFDQLVNDGIIVFE